MRAASPGFSEAEVLLLDTSCGEETLCEAGASLAQRRAFILGSALESGKL